MCGSLQLPARTSHTCMGITPYPSAVHRYPPLRHTCFFVIKQINSFYFGFGMGLAMAHQDFPLPKNLKSTAHFIFEKMELHDGVFPHKNSKLTRNLRSSAGAALHRSRRHLLIGSAAIPIAT